MATRIAINGFGRIGRLVFRALYNQGRFGKDIDVVAVDDLVPADNLAYLLKYDSTQGKFEGNVGSQEVVGRQGRRRRAGRRRPRDQGRQRQGARPSCRGRSSASTIVIESHRPVHRSREGQGPHHRRREEGHHLRPGQGRRHHRRHGREPREVRPRQAQHHLERELHHELPRAGRARAAEGRLRHRRRPDDHHPQLHRHAEDRGRPVEEGLEGRPQRGDQHHPVAPPARPRPSGLVLPGSEGQADRHVVPRADADRVGRRPDRQDRRRRPATRRSAPR